MSSFFQTKNFLRKTITSWARCEHNSAESLSSSLERIPKCDTPLPYSQCSNCSRLLKLHCCAKVINLLAFIVLCFLLMNLNNSIAQDEQKAVENVFPCPHLYQYCFLEQLEIAPWVERGRLLIKWNDSIWWGNLHSNKQFRIIKTLLCNRFADELFFLSKYKCNGRKFRGINQKTNKFDQNCAH